jgi:dihydrofolate reductase
MGRHTYEVGLPLGVTSPYSHLEQYVFSRTTAPRSNDVHHVANEPVRAVQELKRRPGMGIWLCGGGTLASALLPEIDEIVLKVHPVVLREGIALFAGTGAATRLMLRSSHVYTSGVMLNHYVI